MQARIQFACWLLNGKNESLRAWIWQLFLGKESTEQEEKKRRNTPGTKICGPKPDSCDTYLHRMPQSQSQNSWTGIIPLLMDRQGSLLQNAICAGLDFIRGSQRWKYTAIKSCSLSWVGTNSPRGRILLGDESPGDEPPGDESSSGTNPPGRILRGQILWGRIILSPLGPHP